MMEPLFLVLISAVALWGLLWTCYLQSQVDRIRERLDEGCDQFAQLNHRLRVLDCQVAPQHWTDEAAKVYQAQPRIYDDHNEPRPEVWP